MINTIGSVLVAYRPQRKRHFRPHKAPDEPVQINNERKEVGGLLFEEAKKYRRLEKYERASIVLEENRSDIEFALGRSIDNEIFEVRVLTMEEKAYKVFKEWDKATYEEVMQWIKENESDKAILKALMTEGYDFDDLKGTLTFAKINYWDAQGKTEESIKLKRENIQLLERTAQRAKNQLKDKQEELREKKIN